MILFKCFTQYGGNKRKNQITETGGGENLYSLNIVRHK